MADQPNPVAVGLSVLRARRVSPPAPGGSGSMDHGHLGTVLAAVESEGPHVLPEHRGTLNDYRAVMEVVKPNRLSRTEALAFWINLYNAGALDVARRAVEQGSPTVLRIPGAFSQPYVQVDGEHLSLDDIEHGKIRRFKDPRIHAALVCGSASCPTLRRETFVGQLLDKQLDAQMRSFLAAGGAIVDRGRETFSVSRVFLWYGRDFTRPDAMPGIGTARPDRVRDTIAWWLEPEDRDWVWTTSPHLTFQPYDWGLGCSVG